jgi:hypothetical protein
MDKRQISWLIVRAFGVYLLVQACILLPELLAGLFTARYYRNVMSSLGSESGNGGSYTRVASTYVPNVVRRAAATNRSIFSGRTLLCSRGPVCGSASRAES